MGRRDEGVVYGMLNKNVEDEVIIVFYINKNLNERTCEKLLTLRTLSVWGMGRPHDKSGSRSEGWKSSSTRTTHRGAHDHIER